MNDEQFASLTLLKLKSRRTWRPNNSVFLQNCSPLPEIWSLLFNFLEISRAWERFCWIKQNPLKSNELRRNYVLKAFKIEIQKWDQIIQTICRIRSSKKSGHPSLICKNFRCVTAALLNHTERIGMYWMIKNLALSNFLNRDKEGGTK